MKTPQLRCTLRARVSDALLKQMPWLAPRLQCLLGDAIASRHILIRPKMFEDPNRLCFDVQSTYEGGAVQIGTNAVVSFINVAFTNNYASVSEIQLIIASNRESFNARFSSAHGSSLFGETTFFGQTNQRLQNVRSERPSMHSRIPCLHFAVESNAIFLQDHTRCEPHLRSLRGLRWYHQCFFKRLAFPPLC